MFRCLKRKVDEIDPVEERFNIIVGLIKDLPRPDYNKLKDGMDDVYNGYQKVRKAKTTEEKAIEKAEKETEDIETLEKVIEKEVK